MRNLLLLISFIILIAQTIIGQEKKIDWSKLPGKWRIEKAMNVRDGDTTFLSYKDKTVVYSFDKSGAFIDSTSMKNTIFKGKYVINKAKKSIAFPGIVQTTTFPGTTFKDYVAPSASYEVIVLKITKDEFIYYNKICDEPDPTCINYTYLKR